MSACPDNTGTPDIEFHRRFDLSGTTRSYQRAPVLSWVRVSKSLASWRSCSCSSSGPLVRLTIRPRLTAGRPPISFVQRVRFLYSCVYRNVRESLYEAPFNMPLPYHGQIAISASYIRRRR
jgi:hypothetical protein